uniref:Uncharacterized protein n=1 Tax=viral metagenome TaxID=1070528 RepID=A0A6C0DS23_9ZZZZ
MSNSYLNGIFFQSNEIMDIIDIKKFDPYVLSKEKKDCLFSEVVINTIEPSVIIMPPIISENNCKITVKTVSDLAIEPAENIDQVSIVKTARERDDLIYVKQDDTLFWCLYILHHGFSDYHNIGRNYGVKELEEKSKIYDFVKTNPLLIKNTNTKITNVAIKEIISELISVQRKMSYQCMIASLVYYQKNLIIVDKTKTSMIEFWIDRDNIPSMESADLLQTNVLYRDERGNYKLQLENISISKIMDMRSTMYIWESYDKPLRGLSSYKVHELEDICKKLKIDTISKKYKKNELYEAIQNKIGLNFS